MNENKGLHLLYKNLGETPNEAILRYKKANPELDFLPMTYAGRLDPMAEGLLLVLSEEEIKNKEKYLALNKTYKFEILWGFETDTLDLLGIVSSYQFIGSSEVPNEEKIIEYLKKSVGKFEQLYPVYSSRPVGGKSLFEWAREGKISHIEIPKHEVELIKAEYLSRKQISGKELLKNIIEKVGLVQGDFRQDETINKWKELLEGQSDNAFTIDEIEIEVSSGFYVRQFVSDMARGLNSKAIAYSIKRLSVGSYMFNS
jgi:tRNA pseudouridine(55) synthase